MNEMKKKYKTPVKVTEANFQLVKSLFAMRDNGKAKIPIKNMVEMTGLSNPSLYEIKASSSLADYKARSKARSLANKSAKVLGEVESKKVPGKETVVKGETLMTLQSIEKHLIQIENLLIAFRNQETDKKGNRPFGGLFGRN